MHLQKRLIPYISLHKEDKQTHRAKIKPVLSFEVFFLHFSCLIISNLSVSLPMDCYIYEIRKKKKNWYITRIKPFCLLKWCFSPFFFFFIVSHLTVPLREDHHTYTPTQTKLTSIYITRINPFCLSEWCFPLYFSFFPYCFKPQCAFTRGSSCTEALQGEYRSPHLTGTHCSLTRDSRRWQDHTPQLPELAEQVHQLLRRGPGRQVLDEKGRLGALDPGTWERLQRHSIVLQEAERVNLS